MIPCAGVETIVNIPEVLLTITMVHCAFDSLQRNEAIKNGSNGSYLIRKVYTLGLVTFMPTGYTSVVHRLQFQIDLHTL